MGYQAGEPKTLSAGSPNIGRQEFSNEFDSHLAKSTSGTLTKSVLKSANENLRSEVPHMRPLLALLLITALARPHFAQVTTQDVSLPQGTGVEIELLQDVSSETMKAGQIISFKLVRPIELKGETLLPAGAPATGTVETVRTARKWGKSGAFNLTLQPLKLADGTLVHIDFYRPQRKSEKAEKVGGGIVEATVGTFYEPYIFPLIPLALIGASRKGKPFTIRSGERYLVYVTSTETTPAPVATESPK